MLAAGLRRNNKKGSVGNAELNSEGRAKSSDL